MIYAIRAVGTEFIKFGRAGSVGKRLKELDTGCPYELEIMAVADWPDGAETAIHRLLEDANVKLEWFRATDKASLIVRWMQNLDGLDMLRAEVAKLGGRPQWLSPVIKRRAEREAWWAKNG